MRCNPLTLHHTMDPLKPHHRSTVTLHYGCTIDYPAGSGNTLSSSPWEYKTSINFTLINAINWLYFFNSIHRVFKWGYKSASMAGVSHHEWKA